MISDCKIICKHLRYDVFQWDSMAHLISDGLIIRVVSKNRPGYYWSIDEGIEGYLMQEAELFKVINPGLYGEGSVSFESITRPG